MWAASKLVRGRAFAKIVSIFTCVSTCTCLHADRGYYVSSQVVPMNHAGIMPATNPRASLGKARVAIRTKHHRAKKSRATTSSRTHNEHGATSNEGWRGIMAGTQTHWETPKRSDWALSYSAAKQGRKSEIGDLLRSVACACSILTRRGAQVAPALFKRIA